MREYDARSWSRKGIVGVDAGRREAVLIILSEVGALAKRE